MLWAEHVASNDAGTRDDVFAQVRHEFTDAELVELTGICGLFAVSNRFQDSMRLPIEEQGEVDKIRNSVRADPVRLRGYIEHLVEHWPRTLSSSPALLPHPQPLSQRSRGASSCPPERAGSCVGIEGEGSAAGEADAPDVCRVPLLDPVLATGDAARFFAAAGRLLGGVPNAVRVWAHVPHVGKLVLPFFVASERAGCGGVLTAAYKLLVIARTSYINSARYTLAHAHAMARAENVPARKLAGLAAAGCVSSPGFDARERAALAWAQHVAQNTAKHHDAVFGELKRHFNDAEVVELTALCAETNMVNRFCNALRIPVEPVDELAAFYRAPRVDAAAMRAYLASVLADWPQVLPAPDARAG